MRSLIETSRCNLLFFCGRFGDQKMLLLIHFDNQSILQRTLKQFEPVASNKYQSKNRDNIVTSQASLRPRSRDMFVCLLDVRFRLPFYPQNRTFP